MGTVSRLPVTFGVLNELVSVLQCLFVFRVKVSTVVAVFIRLINHRLRDELFAVSVVLKQLTNLVSTHVRALTVKLLHGLEAFISQNRRNDLVAFNESLTRRRRKSDMPTLLLGFQPHATLNVELVRILTAIRSDIVAVSVNLPLTRISRHVRRRRFNDVKSGTRHILARKTKRTIRLITDRTVKTRETAGPLVHLLQWLASATSLTLGKPNARLCIHTVSVFLTVFIGPRSRSENKSTRARGGAIPAILQEVGLCRVHRANCAVVINPLEQHRCAIRNVRLTIVFGGLRVLPRQQVHVTVINWSTIDLLQATSAGHISTSDGVGVNRVIARAAGNRSISSVLSLCNRSVLRSNNRVNEWSYESNRESSGSDCSAATASYTVKTLHFHEKPFLRMRIGIVQRTAT